MIEGPPLFISGGGPLYENLLKRRKNILKKTRIFLPNITNWGRIPCSFYNLYNLDFPNALIPDSAYFYLFSV